MLEILQDLLKLIRKLSGLSLETVPVPIQFSSNELGVFVSSSLNLSVIAAITHRVARSKLDGFVTCQRFKDLKSIEGNCSYGANYNAAVMVLEGKKGPIMAILDPPPFISKGPPYLFYSDLIEWELSNDPVEAAEFVVAWLLYRKGFYDEVLELHPKFMSREWSFLHACAALRAGLPSRFGVFKEAVDGWDHRLYPDQWGYAQHLAGLGFQLQGSFSKAIECYLAALDVRGDINDPNGYATSSNLALSLAANGEIGRAHV